MESYHQHQMNHHQMMGHHHHQQQQQPMMMMSQQPPPQYTSGHLGTTGGGGNSNGTPLQHIPQSQFPLLPDGTSSSEKALMWNQYNMPESGYSTQAPSVCSHDSYMMSAPPPPPPPQPQPQQSQQPPPPQQQQQQKQEEEETEEDNNVANWINSQNDPGMASKAVPDLLKLLLDEDNLVVQQASVIINQMSRMDTPRQALILNANVVPCVVDCLFHTTDLDTVKNLVGSLYGISTQKPDGVAAICRSNAPPLLIKLLDARIESIVSYAITTIHNVLLESGDAVKTQMRKAGAVHHLIPLLVHNHNAKFLAIVVDCLWCLVVHNQEAKTVMLEMGGTQQLIALLFNHTQQYPKLILNILRLLKVLSVCVHNKQAMLALNAIQPLSSHLMASSASSSSSHGGTVGSVVGASSSIGRDIAQNCLMTLRNLSDAATQIAGLAPFITSLVGFLSASPDSSHVEMAAAVLANLTVNEANKIAAIKANAIPILLNLISHYSGCTSNVRQPKIVDPCMCALRHLTIRHAETYVAHEQVREYNGFAVLEFVMCQERNWAVVKAVLGVVRNLATNPLNAQHMVQFHMLSNLMRILYDAFQEIQKKTNNGMNANADAKLDGVNLYEIVDTSSASLLLLAKEEANKREMLELDCIGFFVTMFYSPLPGVQRPAASILAELAGSRDCADQIQQQRGFHEFVQATFCNQFGQLVVAPTGNQVLQHVTVIMQRLEEHRNKSISMFSY